MTITNSIKGSSITDKKEIFVYTTQTKLLLLKLLLSCLNTTFFSFLRFCFRRMVGDDEWGKKKYSKIFCSFSYKRWRRNRTEAKIFTQEKMSNESEKQCERNKKKSKSRRKSKTNKCSRARSVSSRNKQRKTWPGN